MDAELEHWKAELLSKGSDSMPYTAVTGREVPQQLSLSRLHVQIVGTPQHAHAFGLNLQNKINDQVKPG